MYSRKSMKKFISILFLSFALLFSLSVYAAKVAVIYDSGGKFDKSFNELAYNAAEKFKADTGNDYMDFEAANNAQIEQGLRKLVDRGASVVVAMGFSMADAISVVAAENPDVNFTIIDVNWLQGDNIQKVHPSLKIFTASIDKGLNKNKFIIPGLGDAGDRYMGT